MSDARIIDDEPFRILILADLTGRHEAVLRDRRPFAIDRDDLDDVLGLLEPSCSLPPGIAGTGTTLRFSAMEDFHPDRLIESIPLFRALARLADEPAGESTTVDGGDVLQRILEKSAPSEISQLPADDLRAFIRSVVRPHLVASPSAEQEARDMQSGAAAAEALRRVLRDPGFRSLETSWRSLEWLTARLETGARLRLDVVPVTRAGLLDDLRAADPAETGLGRLLSAGDYRAGLIVALFRFGDREDDIELARRLGRVGRHTGLTVLAGAEPSLVGAESVDDLAEPRSWLEPGRAWSEFRGAPEARHIALALPRFLLRAPYGPDSEEIDAFPFEEVKPPAAHDDFLWANSAVLCAALIAESFVADGWSMRIGRLREVGGLPLHLLRADETRAVPCGEVVLTDRAGDAILTRGPIPVTSVRDTNRVRVVAFQSVADPPAPLPGRWRAAAPDGAR